MSAPNPYAAPIADINAPQIAGAENLTLAGRGARLGAQMLDGLVYLGASALAIIGFVMMASSRKGGDPSPSPVALGLIGLGALLFLGVLIFQLHKLSTTGQTLGKKWMNVRVVKLDGSPVSFSSVVLLRAFVPGLLGAIPYLGSIFSLVDIFFIFREDRRCIHDLIAGTRVVEVPA
jgi:uncharacterized RDD family membrane protein YckC